MELRLQNLLPALLTALAVVLTLSAGMWVLTHWVRKLAPGGRAGAHQLARLIRRTLETLGVIVVVLIGLRGAGLGQPRLTWPQVSDWLMGPGLRILFIFAGAFVLVRITDFFVGHLQLILTSSDNETLTHSAERRKRIDTLGRLLRALTIVIIVGMAMLMALREVHVDITPILTGAGVAGVAIGFGAQTMVKDLIAGVFLILENQIRMGDVITINGKTGLVESIRLRILVLRATDGTVFVFQNGAITEYANLTKDYSYAVLELALAYKEDLDHVTRVLQEIGAELRKDPKFSPKILAPLEILGVESLAGASIGIKMRIKTAPVEQWAVDRELRRRVKSRFDQEHIALV